MNIKEFKNVEGFSDNKLKYEDDFLENQDLPSSATIISPLLANAGIALATVENP